MRAEGFYWVIDPERSKDGPFVAQWVITAVCRSGRVLEEGLWLTTGDDGMLKDGAFTVLEGPLPPPAYLYNAPEQKRST